MERIDDDNRRQKSDSSVSEHIPSGIEDSRDSEHPSSRPNGHDGLSVIGDGSNGNLPGSRDDESDNQQGPPRETQLEIISEQILATLHTSGPIPSSQELYLYSEDHQERILRMAESSRTDESHRRDKVVNSQTRIAWAALWIQSLLVMACVGGSVWLFWVTQSPYSFLLIGIPVMQAIAQLGKSARRRSSNNE